jgi:hypothetical protein
VIGIVPIPDISEFVNTKVEKVWIHFNHFNVAIYNQSCIVLSTINQGEATMKVQIIKDTPKKQFIPFTLSIKVETPEELMELYHRMNNNELPESYKRSIRNEGHSKLGIGFYDNEPITFASRISSPVFDVLEIEAINI